MQRMVSFIPKRVGTLLNCFHLETRLARYAEQIEGCKKTQGIQLAGRRCIRHNDYF